MEDKFPYSGSDALSELSRRLSDITAGKLSTTVKPPFVPIETQLPDVLIALVWLPAGKWNAYETEDLIVRRIWWRFGIVKLKLDTPEES